MTVAVTPTGSGDGSATGSGGDGDGGTGDDGTVHGGCSTSGGSAGALVVGLALCPRRRRRT